MTDRSLNHNALRVIAEYLSVIPRNQTAAYLRVHEGCAYETAAPAATRFFADPRVVAEVERREKEMLGNLELSAQDVLNEIFLVATGDPRELSEHYVGACRYCHGLDHLYQRRRSEYDRDLSDYLFRNKLLVKEGKATPDPNGLLFDVQGGVGFSSRRDPHPECPECDGNGAGYEVFKDTRNLSPAAARLYEGVKKTQNGLEIKIRNRDKALDLAATHLGIARKSVELTGKGGGPVRHAVAAVSLTDVDPQTASQLYQALME